MHSVFKSYVRSFLDIILSDDIFNRYEFVILLENVLQSMQYLRNTLKMVSQYMEELEEKVNEKRIAVNDWFLTVLYFSI